ncbi:hypothetical protein SEPCBS119000_000488 [Sporothrix epigloea]|uniref:Uncharacterized protein n=1 Tax=Sporothrix epigloea TaxID=1892477 RepID=A0ABP0D5D6_9PEZI
MSRSGATGTRREPPRTEETGRLNKRRKLDADKAAPSLYTAFRYGRYGQVEPGTLTMEIVSCDGGLYSDGSSYAAENILKNDSSVYCTKSNRCNIVLQHQGCTPFSLKELIIKAPGKNYSSPIKAGMVYLSMSKDELLRAEQYNSDDCNVGVASLHRAAQEICAHGYSASPLLDYLNSDAFRSMRYRGGRGGDNDNVDAAHEQYVQDMRRLVESTRASLQDAATSRQSGGQEEIAQPGFVVLTECSDDDEDEVPGRLGRERDSADRGWRWSPTVLRDRPRRRLSVYNEFTSQRSRMPWEVVRYGEDDDNEDENVDDNDGDDVDDDDDDDDDYTDLYELELGNTATSSPDSLPNNGEERTSPVRPRSHGRTQYRRHGRDRTRNRGGEHGATEAASTMNSFNRASLQGHNSTLSTRPSSSRSALLPQAEFYIEPGKNKCTIVFSPPVTARFILLKMWNPSMDFHNNSNIDIQGVVAKGFAGPRYFPALELR